MKTSLSQKVCLLSGMLLLGTTQVAVASTSADKSEKALTRCYQQFDKQMGQSQYKQAVGQLKRCGRELQNAINSQVAMDMAPHRSQLESMTQSLANETGETIVPYLVFAEVAPIEKKHAYRLNNVQKYLLELHEQVKREGDKVNIERSADRFDKAVVNLEQNVPDYDLSQYTQLKDQLMAEASDNLGDRERYRVARLEAMSVARDLERLNGLFYLSQNNWSAWDDLHNSTDMKPIIDEWRVEFQAAPGVIEALDAIEAAYAKLEATADGYFEEAFSKHLNAMSQYQDGNWSYYNEYVAQNMRDAASILDNNLKVWSQVHPKSSVLSRYLAAYSASVADLEERIATGEKAQKQRLQTELMNRTLPPVAVQQDQAVQQEVLRSLQSYSGKFEYLRDIQRIPWQTSHAWYQENHPLTGEPQTQSATFRAGVKDAKGVCHVVKIEASRIHTGGGNWSAVTVDGFFQDYPILCDRLS